MLQKMPDLKKGQRKRPQGAWHLLAKSLKGKKILRLTKAKSTKNRKNWLSLQETSYFVIKLAGYGKSRLARQATSLGSVRNSRPGRSCRTGNIWSYTLFQITSNRGLRTNFSLKFLGNIYKIHLSKTPDNDSDYLLVGYEKITVAKGGQRPPPFLKDKNWQLEHLSFRLCT